MQSNISCFLQYFQLNFRFLFSTLVESKKMSDSHSTRIYYNRSDRSGGDDQAGGNKIMKVESKHIGRIIGPAGRTIQDLQRQYNVRINISKSENDDGTKDVDIIGNPDDISQVRQK